MGVPSGLYYSNAWPFWVLQRKATYSYWQSQGDYCQCKMDSQKRQAIVLVWSRKPRSFFNSRPPVVHIQTLFSPAAHHPKAPTPPLTRCISPFNPSRNVALVMERMPGVCPAGAVASKRTGACRSANLAWTVDWSTASRRATAPPQATPCVVTACQGERTYLVLSFMKYMR